jgi:hypothetical protein
MFTFGQTPTFQSDEKFELDVSDDGEAWTLTFSDFVARAGALIHRPRRQHARFFSSCRSKATPRERISISMFRVSF